MIRCVWRCRPLFCVVAFSLMLCGVVMQCCALLLCVVCALPLRAAVLVPRGPVRCCSVSCCAVLLSCAVARSCVMCCFPRSYSLLFWFGLGCFCPCLLSAVAFWWRVLSLVSLSGRVAGRAMVCCVPLWYPAPLFCVLWCRVTLWCCALVPCCLFCLAGGVCLFLPAFKTSAKSGKWLKTIEDYAQRNTHARSKTTKICLTYVLSVDLHGIAGGNIVILRAIPELVVDLVANCVVARGRPSILQGSPDAAPREAKKGMLGRERNGVGTWRTKRSDRA